MNRPEQKQSLVVFPKILRANQETILTFVAPIPFVHGDYRLLMVSLQHPRGPLSHQAAISVALDANTGNLRARITPVGEQEHQLRLYDEATPFDYNQPLAVLAVYSLEPELYALTPYKGDLHMHSSRSDGKDDPAHVAAACRRIGLDFMALTDHGQYAPSLEAREAFSGAAVDLRIYPGEEVHAPGNPIHIVNFGGGASVNDMFDREEYHRQVAVIEAAAGDLPEGLDRYEYASSVWIFEQIRSAGGLGIFCHPYWLFPHADSVQGYYISESLVTRLLDTQPFDALELLGGYYVHEAASNMIQVARYQDERAKGRRIPIVGVSDAHGCETGSLFGWYYTLVFAASPELADLIAGIKGLNSVAVEALPGEVVRVYGPFRLVKYALFLLRVLFPAHDVLCAEESAAMFSLIGESGPEKQQQAVILLDRCKGRTADLMARDLGR